MYTEWENKKDQFKVIDLRQAKGNFSQGLFRQANQVPEGSGLQKLSRASNRIRSMKP